MPSIKCPHCNHKPFRSENGLKWHLEHIHGNAKYMSGFPLKPRPESELREADGIDNKQALQNLKREIEEEVKEIEEKINSRLDIFTQRDSWLSERISALEQITQKRRVA